MNEKYKKWMAEYLQTCAAENLKHWGDNDVPEFEQQFAKYFAERASSFEDATGKQFCWEGPLLDKTECQRQLESIGTPLSEIAKLEWPKGYMELVGIVETKLAMIQNRRTVRKKSKGKSVAECDLILQAALENTATAKQYLFASGEELQKLIGASRRTIEKTRFWNERMSRRTAYRQDRILERKLR